ncbi:MAG: ketoacyl-ACP synthase III [Alphaproteobacteria bacterium]|nr:ketoacyl-ACP synthase III [Alphaproteobacteria bacterium]
MTLIRSEIIGHGHYLPAKVLTNDDLSKMVETNDEWISTRTGIKQRHIVTDELTSDMAVAAARKAIDSAGISVEDVELVICATVTPDNTTPAVSAKIGGKLGVKSGTPTFDISAACSGVVYALTMADNMIRLGQVKCAVVIGAESLSKIVDWTDRNTCVLFGDGAGAVVLRACEGNGDKTDTGILSTRIYSDGTHYESLKSTGGVSSTQTAGFIYMDGKEVFKYAINSLSQAAEDVMADAGVKAEDIDLLIPHQANIRIINGVGQKLGLPEEKVVVTVNNHGNTSAASIPLAISESFESGKIKKGDLVVLTAMGAGFTWGGALIRF